MIFAVEKVQKINPFIKKKDSLEKTSNSSLFYKRD